VRGRVRRVDDSPQNGAGTHVYLVEAPTRDVSSTTIRSRLARQLAIDDLVPAAVARHIVRHQLYGAADRLHGQDTQRGK
jgi:nicotinic acid mononucleotide adenylyltransferase